MVDAVKLVNEFLSALEDVPVRQRAIPDGQVLTIPTDGRIVPASAPLVRAVTVKSVAGIGILSVARRPNRAKSPFARFPYGRGRGRTLGSAAPCCGNANSACPATRDWHLRWLVDPTCTEVSMYDHGEGASLPAKLTFQDIELTVLTVAYRGRKVTPINGKNPLWGCRNLLFTTVSRHVSYGYFCARIPGASSRLGREGGEYKTLRGNKPACLVTGFEPPATSAVVESLIGGVVKRYHEGFDMTVNTLPESVRFQDTDLSIIDHNGAEWFASPDIARALGYPRSDDPMPRLCDGQALFVIEGRQVIVDTRDYRLNRGDRAVVIRVEDGAGPIVVTILGDPPIKTWFDRCKIYDSGVKCHIPVGVVIGRVVWEGA